MEQSKISNSSSSMYGAIDGGGGGGVVEHMNGESNRTQHGGDNDPSSPHTLSAHLARHRWIHLIGVAILMFVYYLTLSSGNNYESLLQPAILPGGSSSSNSRLDEDSTLLQSFWSGIDQAMHTLFRTKHDMNQELFYHKQLVNHFNGSTSTLSSYNNKDTWKNRYYKSTEYFKGPGHPIFHVVGGEGALDFGMMYPFITRHLAPYFGAAVIQVEHRFYGTYPPIPNATVSDLLELLTPQQAMADNVQLGRSFKEELGCSFDRTSPKYCPVITVGGSYPGFLAAILRVAHSDYVDISYASSAPLKLYDQSTDQNVYYDIVSYHVSTSLYLHCAQIFARPNLLLTTFTSIPMFVLFCR